MQDNTIPLRIISGGDPGPANPADPASGGGEHSRGQMVAKLAYIIWEVFRKL